MFKKPRRLFVISWWSRGYQYKSTIEASGRRRAAEKLERLLIKAGITTYSVESVKPKDDEIPF